MKTMTPLAYAVIGKIAVLGVTLASMAFAETTRSAEPSSADIQKLMTSFSESTLVNTQKSGQAIYDAICAGCHMPRAEGAIGSGFYPKLANNSKLAAAAYPTTVVITGLHGMPSFAHRLNDAQIAAVVNYVRTNFGNHYSDEVTAEQVANVRKQAAPDLRSSYDFNEY